MAPPSSRPTTTISMKRSKSTTTKPASNGKTEAERAREAKYALLRRKKEERAEREQQAKAAAKTTTETTTTDGKDGTDGKDDRGIIPAGTSSRTTNKGETSGRHKKPSSASAAPDDARAPMKKQTVATVRKLPGAAKPRRPNDAPMMVSPSHRRAQDAGTKDEPVDPAIERAKAILAGLRAKKQRPGVAQTSSIANENAAGGGAGGEVKKPKLVFTMGKREVKTPPPVVHAPEDAPRAPDDGPTGYASTAIGYAPTVGYASTEIPAAETTKAVLPEKIEPAPEPIIAPPKVEEKKEIKRPGVLKRPGAFGGSMLAKKLKPGAPTPFPEATDGVGERTDKAEREVFINNLPEGCKVETLSLACYRYGRVNSCRVLERKNIGFVTFADSASAEKIVNASNAHMSDPDREPVIVDGHVVMVDYSDKRAEYTIGGKGHLEEIRQRAKEELERIRDGEIIEDEPELLRREMMVYEDI